FMSDPSFLCGYGGFRVCSPGRSRVTSWLVQALVAVVLATIEVGTAAAGMLTQFDSTGAHTIFPSGVQDASVAFGPFGQVVAVVFDSGALIQFDALGTHLIAASGIKAASIAFGPS